MREILNQIELALTVNLYYLALFVSLTLPDICGAIDSDDGEASGAKYKAWFDKYMTPKYIGFLTGDDCYFFRCSLLHQGSSQHSRSSYSRILFVEPGAEMSAHCTGFNDTLGIDLRIFCGDMISSVKQWLDETENTEKFENNYNKFMKRHPQGLPPYIKGVPVIG